MHRVLLYEGECNQYVSKGDYKCMLMIKRDRITQEKFLTYLLLSTCALWNLTSPADWTQLWIKCLNKLLKRECISLIRLTRFNFASLLINSFGTCDYRCMCRHNKFKKSLVCSQISFAKLNNLHILHATLLPRYCNVGHDKARFSSNIGACRPTYDYRLRNKLVTRVIREYWSNILYILN